MEARSWSRLAVAGLALAGTGLLVVFLAGFGYHHGWWSLRVAFGRRVLGLPLLGVLPIGTLLAMLGALLSLAGIAHALRAHLGGVGLGAVGFVAGVVPSVMVLYQYHLARTVPPINDISTDLQNPPAYVAAAANDFWKGKEMGYPAGFADSVRRGYPDLAALALPIPAARAFGLVHRTAAGMPAWEITAVDSAAGPELDVFDAASVGATARVAELLDREPSLVNAYSGDGFYPLGLAAFFAHPETVRLLLARGADVAQAAKNPMRVQPLHAAAAGRSFQAVKLLVDAGAPGNGRQQEGWTPLQEAVQSGDLEMTCYLLAHGADPRQQNDAGKSAIGLAAERGNVEILKLLKAGAP